MLAPPGSFCRVSIDVWPRSTGMTTTALTTKHGDTFLNQEPIGDLEAALRLLERPWQSNSLHLLHCKKGEHPCIEIQTFRGGYTKDEYSSSEFYLLSLRVVEELLAQNCVSGYEGGYCYNPKETFRLSPRGQNVSRHLLDARIEAAKARLIPGEHGNSSLYRYVRQEWTTPEKGWRNYQHLRFIFTNPFEEHIAVYPDRIEVLPKDLKP